MGMGLGSCGGSLPVIPSHHTPTAACNWLPHALAAAGSPGSWKGGGGRWERARLSGRRAGRCPPGGAQRQAQGVCLPGPSSQAPMPQKRSGILAPTAGPPSAANCSTRLDELRCVGPSLCPKPRTPLALQQLL